MPIASAAGDLDVVDADLGGREGMGQARGVEEEEGEEEGEGHWARSSHERQTGSTEVGRVGGAANTQ